MTTKRVLYTYTPAASPPGVLVIRRNSDGYTLDAVDGAFRLTPGTATHTAVESASTPGLYIWDSDGNAWQDDIYRVFWYQDGTFAAAPVVWVLSLYGDLEVPSVNTKGELGMAEANLDDQLAAILAAANAGGGSSLDAAELRAALGMGEANLDLQLDTLDIVRAKTDLIVAPGTVSGWTNPNSALPLGGPTLVTRLFSDTRTVLHDIEANLYDNTLLLPLYNRAISEINSLLVMLQADVAITTGNITGDGVNYSFALPANFLAPVPGQFKPRSPETATNNYTWGRALEHYDRMGTQLTALPTTVAAPSRFHIISDTTAQYAVFDSIPPSGYIYDLLYFTVPTAVTATTLSTAVVPWLGFLDNLVSRSLEEFAREGKEFTSDKRALWRARAEADISMILGLRHLQTQERIPSLFRNMPRTSEVW